MQKWAKKQHIEGAFDGVWTWCYQRAVFTPITPANLVWTNMRVADRLGVLIATWRGPVGDFLPSLVYFFRVEFEGAVGGRTSVA